VILAFEPVAASITSILWYGEPFTRSFAIGGALILAAMFMSQRRHPSSALRAPSPRERGEGTS
jgi:drug/metabolite transporter (DMT)-like permease